MKKHIYDILAVSQEKGSMSWYFDVFIITLIILNVLTIILESVESINNEYSVLFAQFEVFSVIIFSIEYVLRVWTANLNPRYAKPFLGNLKYALTPMLMIDLLAVLPFYLPLFGFDLRVLRTLRIFRIFRLLKIARYVKALSFMTNVVKDKREELVVSLIFTLFLLLIASTVMYYIENPAQPDSFSSIPQTMWWGIATLTTVGYGDVYPVTPLGRLLGGMIAIIGIGLFALPAGILASGFSDEISKSKEKPKENYCEVCQKKLAE